MGDKKNSVFAVWSPSGNNTARLSLQIAEELSSSFNVLLAELPCLGIPKLCFETDILDRGKSIDACIRDSDKKGDFNLDNSSQYKNEVAVLQASSFIMPDSPITNKVELETLIRFPQNLIQKAKGAGYNAVVLECQGQLTTPMTFFSIEHADKVIVPVNSTGDIAVALLNIKRLIQIYKINADNFKFIAKKNPEIVSEIATIEEENNSYRLDVFESPSMLISEICKGMEAVVKKESKKSLFGFRKKPKEEIIQKDQLKEQTTEESEEIRIRL